MSNSLFEPYVLGPLQLKNKCIMAPLTRCRAINGNLPNDIMATYYGQRSGAGFIIAEGTSPSPNGLGYTNIPGLFTEEHARLWKKSTDSVHNKGGIIFLQMMHTGRVTQIENLPKGARVIGVSSVAKSGEVKTYSGERLPYSTPHQLTTEEVKKTIDEYIDSAKLAIQAGFDGVEIHCAHGYLPNQFINTETNTRKDEYGGSIENRCRFVLEIAEKMCAAIGTEKVGIRISPFSYADTQEDGNDLNTLYAYLAAELQKLNLVYLHLSHMGDADPRKFSLWKELRKTFTNTLILCGDFTKETAQEKLDSGEADLIAFGRDFIGNPDLVERMKNNWPLAERNRELWYGNGAEGYIDYPFYSE